MITVDDLPRIDTRVRVVLAALGRNAADTSAAAWALMEDVVGRKWCEDGKSGKWYSVVSWHFEHLEDRLRQRLMPLAESAAGFLQGDGNDFASELLAACEKYLQTRGIELDGPVKPDGFRFGNRVVFGLPAKVWATLDHLWHRPNRRCAWDDHAGPVWRDHARAVTDGMMRGVQAQATKYFDEHAIPYRISLDRQERSASVVALPE